MGPEVSKGDLGPHQRWLIELMQGIQFGRIEGLAVRAGRPVVSPPPRVVRELKIGGDNQARREGKLEDFVLKQEVRELLDHIARLGHGIIHTIEIRHGLPFRLTVEEVAA